MSYKAGGIEYDIEVDTSEMISAGDDVENKLSDMQSSFAKADKMVKDFEKSIRSSGGSISKHGVVLDKHGNEVAKDTKRMQMLTSQVNTLSKRMKSSQGGFTAVGSSAQQAGYQIGDFATQVASGQSALVAFTQQGTQFVSMFGPKGAIAGSILAIGGAIGVALLPSLFKSGKSIDENTEKAKELAKEYGYSEEAIAAYQRATDKKIKKEEEAIKKTKERIQSIKDQISAQEGMGESIAKSLLPSGGIRETIEGISGLNVESIAEQLDSQKAKEELDNLIVGLANSQAELKKLKEDSDAVAEIPKKQQEFQEDLNKALQMQEALMNGGELQAKKLAAAFQLNLTNAEQLPKEISKTIEELHRMEEVASQPSLVDALKEQFVQQSKLRAELKMSSEDADVFQARMTLGAQASQKEIDKLAEEIKAVNILKQTLSDSKQAASFVESGKYQDPIERLKEREERELEMLRIANEDKLITEEEFQERKTNLVKYYEERRAKISKGSNNDSKQVASFIESGKYQDPLERLKEQEERELEMLRIANDNKLITEEEFQERKTNLVESYEEKRAQISKDTNENIVDGYSQLTGAISGAFGMATQALKESEGEQSGIYKTMFAMQKGFAVAQAGLNMWSAISQVMADQTSLTPAEKFANYAAVAASMGGVISSISSASYGGGRQYGGPVSPNTMYEVNETGVPEIVSAGGKDYMTMGNQGGKVTPLDKSGMGGGVTVNNYGSPDLVEVKQVDRGWVIEVARREANRAQKGAVAEVAANFRDNKGRVYNAAAQNGNYRGKAGTGR